MIVFRNTFGRALLLSLEILIAADLTRTLTVEPTMENVLVLGVIVIIRSVLSISLDIEMEGVVPWRRRALEARRLKTGDLSRCRLRPGWRCIEATGGWSP